MASTSQSQGLDNSESKEEIESSSSLEEYELDVVKAEESSKAPTTIQDRLRKFKTTSGLTYRGREVKKKDKDQNVQYDAILSSLTTIMNQNREILTSLKKLEQSLPNVSSQGPVDHFVTREFRGYRK